MAPHRQRASDDGELTISRVTAKSKEFRGNWPALPRRLSLPPTQGSAISEDAWDHGGRAP
jgi:hypothetical protein